MKLIMTDEWIKKYEILDATMPDTDMLKAMSLPALRILEQNWHDVMINCSIKRHHHASKNLDAIINAIFGKLYVGDNFEFLIDDSIYDDLELDDEVEDHDCNIHWPKRKEKIVVEE